MSTFAQILIRELAKQQAAADAALRSQQGMFTRGWGVLVQQPVSSLPFQPSAVSTAAYAAARRERKGGV